jgi:phosphinothricin acetyltransferase
MAKQRPAIRKMMAYDWPSVRRIYEEGIASGNATFESAAPTWQEWDTGHLRNCRLIAIDSGRVVGWAALSPVSSRCVYAGVAEVSVYVASDAQGRGIGSHLLRALVTESERKGIWTLQASLFPENEASVALHERCGFRMVGRRQKLGQMNGRWRDVLLLEKRSVTVGIRRTGRR